jgi:hypothetical protein
MSNWRHCSCQRCRIRGLLGPLLLITIGALFLMGEYSRYSFGELWPVILIVIGAVKVAESMASVEGHVGP